MTTHQTHTSREHHGARLGSGASSVQSPTMEHLEHHAARPGRGAWSTQSPPRHARPKRKAPPPVRRPEKHCRARFKHDYDYGCLGHSREIIGTQAKEEVCSKEALQLDWRTGTSNLALLGCGQHGGYVRSSSGIDLRLQTRLMLTYP
eukprot:CAMPEP_0119414832 /NCGR_PEP_ID=MMETSP1335-20130426/7200_1 /TAXON_ID=259385 /ORGANISM="Chrysoculter rhomboideus, Strain RCC1486" /LENGTH=146 /DNA_ID=CAMNT_0007439727 /DNA_START=36 /DNA_END=476 /DNA_ORIENTATION=-